MSDKRCACGNTIFSHNANRGMVFCMDCTNMIREAVAKAQIMEQIDEIDTDKHFNDIIARLMR